jgi:hypothetical protein
MFASIPIFTGNTWFVPPVAGLTVILRARLIMGRGVVLLVSTRNESPSKLELDTLPLLSVAIAGLFRLTTRSMFQISQSSTSVRFIRLFVSGIPVPLDVGRVVELNICDPVNVCVPLDGLISATVPLAFGPVRSPVPVVKEPPARVLMGAFKPVVMGALKFVVMGASV